MKNDLTTGTWQDNIWCPINIILFCTSDVPFWYNYNTFFLPSLIVTPSQVRVRMPLPLLLCCISGLGPEGLLHNSTILVWSPGNLLRVTFASTLKKFCLRKPPTRNSTAKVLSLGDSLRCSTHRETGDIIARTRPYTQLPTDAPTRTRFFGFTSNVLPKKRPVSLKRWLLRPFSTRKPHAKAVP